MENLKELVPDKQQLHVLMAVFPGSRDINPIQWDKTIDFWKQRIINYCIFKRRVWFTPDELFHHFEAHGDKPWCLLNVITELMKTKFLIDRNSLAAKYSWVAWSTKHFVWTPLTYLSSIGSYLSSQHTYQVDATPQQSPAFLSQVLFIPSILQDLSRSPPQHSPGSVDAFECVFTPEEFCEKFLKDVVDVETRFFILQSWKMTGKVKHTVIKGKEIYKINNTDITERDLSVLEMKHSVQSFEAKIDTREKEHDDLMTKVKQLLANGNKNEAKRYLRQAKVKREEIHKYKMAVDRLSESKSTIDSAHLNAQFISAVKGSADVLKKMQSPSQVNDATEVMGDLDEQIALAQEISSAMSTPTAGTTIDLTELEDELANLILSSKSESSKEVPVKLRVVDNEILDQLPKTPSGIPKPSTTATSEPQAEMLAG